MNYQRNQGHRTVKWENDYSPRTMSVMSRNDDAAKFTPGDAKDVEKDNANCFGMPSLAMVYSPDQHFDNMYEPDDGLIHGTIFKELDKPFCGGKRA